MKYMVLSEEYSSDLREKVEQWMGYGWKPQGSVSVSTSFFETRYAQAMIKEKE